MSDQTWDQDTDGYRRYLDTAADQPPALSDLDEANRVIGDLTGDLRECIGQRDSARGWAMHWESEHHRLTTRRRVVLHRAALIVAVGVVVVWALFLAWVAARGVGPLW